MPKSQSPSRVKPEQMDAPVDHEVPAVADEPQADVVDGVDNPLGPEDDNGAVGDALLDRADAKKDPGSSTLCAVDEPGEDGRDPRRAPKNGNVAALQDSGAAVVPLRVTNCSVPKIAEGVHGLYHPISQSHGRPAYKRQEKARGFAAYIYFWDSRDGDELRGWWIGPSLGGQDVWVYHPDHHAERPPVSGWIAPHDGPVDLTMRVQPELQGALGMEGANGSEEDTIEERRWGYMQELQRDLDEVRREGEEQMKQMLELQLLMEQRRKKEEDILSRMRELIALVPRTALRARGFDGILASNAKNMDAAIARVGATPSSGSRQEPKSKRCAKTVTTKHQ